MYRNIIEIFSRDKPESMSMDEEYRSKLLVASSFFTAAFIATFSIYRAFWINQSDHAFFTQMAALLVLVSAPFLYKYSGLLKISGVYVNIVTEIPLLSEQSRELPASVAKQALVS